MNGPNMVVRSHHGTGEAFQNYAESSRCDVEAAGLEPDTIRIRNPETVIFQIDVGDEVFAAPLIRIETVSETVEGGDRHMSPFLCVSLCGSPGPARITFSREPQALTPEDRNSKYRHRTSTFRRPAFPKPRRICRDRSAACRLDR